MLERGIRKDDMVRGLAQLGLTRGSPSPENDSQANPVRSHAFCNFLQCDRPQPLEADRKLSSDCCCIAL